MPSDDSSDHSNDFGEPQKARDRRRILERRAFFVSSALTVLTGCPPDTQAPATGSATPAVVATVPETDAGALPPATGSVSVAPAPAGSKVEIPPLTVPDDVSPVAKSHFERLRAVVPKIHAELEQAERASLCDIEDAACDPTWSAIAGHLAKAREERYDLPARCSGSSADAKRFEASLREHQRAIDKRTALIEARIAAALDSEPKKNKWEAHKAGASVRRPCLKYSCEDW